MKTVHKILESLYVQSRQQFLLYYYYYYYYFDVVICFVLVFHTGFIMVLIVQKLNDEKSLKFTEFYILCH
jgi:hypothetical protein